MTQPYSSAPVADHRPEPVPSRNGSNLSERVRSLRLSENTQSGGSRSSVLPWIVCVLCVLMTAGFGYRAYRITPAAEGAEINTTPTTAPTTSVAAPSAASSGEVALEVKGNVTPIHQFQVSPKIGGQLLWLADNFQEGAFFKKGEKLAEIEDVDYRTDYEHSKAAVDAAKGDLEEQKANMEQLRLSLRRTMELTRSSAATTNDYEVAKYGYDALVRRVHKLEASIMVAEADLAKAKWRLDNIVVVAPVDGTILTKKAELYNLVNPSAFSNGLSASLCDMADLTEQEVEVMVQERDRPNVFVGQKCNVMPQAFQYDETFIKSHPGGYQGVVSRIMPNADRSKGAIPVRVKVIFPSDEIELYHKEGKWSGYVIPDMGAVVTFKKKSN
jgi:HlyD family secretion protein